MKKINAISKSLLLSSIICTNTFSNENVSNRWTYAVGSEGQYYNYREPDLMHTMGWMLGINGEATYLFSNNYFVTLETRVLGGKDNYSSYETGKLRNGSHSMTEVRSLVGYNWQLKENSILSAYTGLGYRYKRDGETGSRTTTGHIGYERKSHYFYLPLGIKYKISFNKDYSLGIRGECDLLLQGQQQSDLFLDGRTLNHDQNSGFGLKASVDIIKNLDDKHALSFGPYLHYWDIDDSNTVLNTHEPHNKTYETGISIKYHF